MNNVGGDKPRGERRDVGIKGKFAKNKAIILFQ